MDLTPERERIDTVLAAGNWQPDFASVRPDVRKFTPSLPIGSTHLPGQVPQTSSREADRWSEFPESTRALLAHADQVALDPDDVGTDEIALLSAQGFSAADSRRFAGGRLCQLPGSAHDRH
jgi:alkylhydroperoxidase family enzyme